jgi:predicted DNA-binding transcriptional regulator AlpA
MTNLNNWQSLIYELQNEFTRIELENATLKERLKQMEMQKITPSKPQVDRVEWTELETGKRFLTTKDLSKYLSLAPSTISNQMFKGVFPIRHKKMGRNVRFDIREVLEYLDTDKPFWERDQELRKRR